MILGAKLSSFFRARANAREASIGTYDACVSIDHFFFRLSCRSFALSTVVEAGVEGGEKLFRSAHAAASASSPSCPCSEVARAAADSSSWSSSWKCTDPASQVPCSSCHEHGGVGH